MNNAKFAANRVKKVDEHEILTLILYGKITLSCDQLQNARLGHYQFPYTFGFGESLTCLSHAFKNSHLPSK